MDSMDYRDRESRFQDACKFAAAVVVVGMIVIAGEAAMHRGEDATIHGALQVIEVAPSEYFPGQYTLQAGEPDEHVQAF
jgi:hypothetical protein